MSNFAFALLLTTISGMFTVIGGILALFVKRENTRFLAGSLGFSAGVMLYISLIEIFPSAYESLANIYNAEASYIITTISFFSGIILVMFLSRLLPKNDFSKQVGTEKFSSLRRTGLMVALVITLHNIPEGLVTFMGALQNHHTGIAIALAIAIHNLPEGIAVSVPIYYATNSRKKAFYYCLISAIAGPIGAVIGYFLLLPIMSDQVLAIVFVMISGAMVFIAVDELLPAAYQYAEKSLAAYGVVGGMALMAATLIFFM